jgi:hypothetical protein
MPQPPIRITAKILKTIDRTANFGKALAALEKTDVLVGIPREKAAREPDPKTGKVPGINNAALGYIHNYGMPTKNIPARPFMEPGIKDVQGAISPRMGDAARAALTGRPDVVLRNLNAAGLVAQVGIQKKIRSGPFQPLKPATLAARRRRGRTGTKPLIDTSQLLQHISYVVRTAK